MTLSLSLFVIALGAILKFAIRTHLAARFGFSDLTPVRERCRFRHGGEAAGRRRHYQ
jgi:hypothetical protein